MYVLTTKMPKYTPKLVQFMEGSDDFPLPIHLQSKYPTSYHCALYGGWSFSMPVPDVGNKFLFCGNSYMISKSNIDASHIWFFILSHVFVPPKQSIALMPFCGPPYSRSYYLNIVKYKHSISMHCMCMNGYVTKIFNRKNMLHIDGCPQTHGNIAWLINRYISSLFSANC